MNEKNNKRTIFGWSMYDWAKSAYETTILGAVLPVYFVSVIVPEEGEEKTVTDKKFIGEWVKGMSSAESKQIQEKLDEINKQGFDHSYNVVCEECGTKFSTSVEFNVSNFFGTGS